MKNFAKIFLIYTMVLLSFSQNSQAGFSSSKEEIDENSQDSHYVRRHPNLETSLQPSSSIYSPLGILDENFNFGF